MNENRNIIWIAVIGVAILLLVAVLLRPHSNDLAPVNPETGAPLTSGTSEGAFPNDPPLAPAVPVLPPEPGAPSPTTPESIPGPGTTPGDAVLPGASPAPPEVPAPSGPTPAQPNIPAR